MQGRPTVRWDEIIKSKENNVVSNSVVRAFSAGCSESKVVDNEMPRHPDTVWALNLHWKQTYTARLRC